MKIGIDASRAFIDERTGTENYSYKLIKALAKLDRENKYTIYVCQLASKGDVFQGWPGNFRFKVIHWPRFWTQAGLALECLINPPDVLLIPAHTMPVIRRWGQKIVVTIHDLGSEFLPEYHQFPQKIYLNFSTVYAVKNATKIIAVSKSTKKDLIKKLGGDPNKIVVVHEGP